VIAGAEKSAADCARRSPGSLPSDAGSFPATSTPQWALRTPEGSPVDLVRVTADVVSIADALGLD